MGDNSNKEIGDISAFKRRPHLPISIEVFETVINHLRCLHLVMGYENNAGASEIIGLVCLHQTLNQGITFFKIQRATLKNKNIDINTWNGKCKRN